MTNSELIEKYKKEIIDGYKVKKTYRGILDIIKPELVKETDGQFTRIFIRKIISREWFESEEPDASLIFFDFGKAIKAGEERFFVKEIIDKKQIEGRITVNEIKNLNAKLIITDIDIQYNLLLKNSIIYYNNSKRGFYMNETPVISVLSDHIKGKIIVLEEGWGKIKMKENNKETIFIEINPEKREIYCYSLMKIDILDKSKIKIYTLEE